MFSADPVTLHHMCKRGALVKKIFTLHPGLLAF